MGSISRILYTLWWGHQNSEHELHQSMKRLRKIVKTTKFKCQNPGRLIYTLYFLYIVTWNAGSLKNPSMPALRFLNPLGKKRKKGPQCRMLKTFVLPDVWTKVALPYYCGDDISLPDLSPYTKNNKRCMWSPWSSKEIKEHLENTLEMKM